MEVTKNTNEANSIERRQSIAPGLVGGHGLGRGSQVAQKIVGDGDYVPDVDLARDVVAPSQQISQKSEEAASIGSSQGFDQESADIG